MKMLVARFSLCAVVAAGLCGCSAEPETQEARDTLTSQTHSTLTSFKNQDPTLADLLSRSKGYAVFPDVGKAGFIVGGAYGRGQVFESNGTLIGYADMTKGSVGLQAGAQTFDELIVFMNDETLRKFKTSQFSLSADASAVAIKSGGAAAADYSKGVIVFAQSTGGLMAEMSVGGQKFKFEPMR